MIGTYVRTGLVCVFAASLMACDGDGPDVSYAESPEAEGAAAKADCARGDLECLERVEDPGGSMFFDPAEDEEGEDALFDFEIDDTEPVVSVVGDAVVVDEALFDLLGELPEGTSVEALEHPDVERLMAHFEAQRPAADAPRAVCSGVTLPMAEDGCVWADADELDGGSYSPEDNAIKLSIEEPEVCGEGEHFVELVVTDDFDRTSRCTALVTLCDAERDPEGCNPHSLADRADEEGPGEEIADRRANQGVTCSCTTVVTGTFLSPSEDASKNGETAVNSQGKGPSSVVIADVKGRTCKSVNLDESGDNDGWAKINAKLLCLNANGDVCQPPASCTARIDGYASYQSLAVARARSKPCKNPVVSTAKAYAQDQARLQAINFDANKAVVRTKTGFAKSLAVQVGKTQQAGRDTTIAPDRSLLPADAKTDKGFASNLKVPFGLTSLSKETVALKNHRLKAAGQVSTGFKDTAAQLVLENQANFSVKTTGNAKLGAAVLTEHWILLASARSTCPGASQAVFGMAKVQDGGSYQSARDKAHKFLKKAKSKLRLDATGALVGKTTR